jgi:1-acyl-sn-glycerol-3-phosphate acyltransferase
MLSVLVTVYFWGFMLLTSLLLFPVAVALRLVTDPFDKRLALLHRFTSFWGSLYTWGNPFWHVTIAGTEHLDTAMPVVMVANHQSFADILLLFRLRAHYKWVSKAENFRVPLIGWNMSLNRYIRIERGSIRGNLKMMRDCEVALRDGNSVMIFPEGTRSSDGRMRQFKEGAFELALRMRRPILPIIIAGTGEALPRRGILLRGRHHMQIRILPPVHPDSFRGKSAQQLSQEVFALMATSLSTGVVVARG